MYIRYFYITYMKSIQQNIKNLKVNGITTIKNVLSAKQCNLYTKYCNEVFQKLLKKKRTHSFNKNCQKPNLTNPFLTKKGVISFLTILFQQTQTPF